jgi:hypothetical protein
VCDLPYEIAVIGLRACAALALAACGTDSAQCDDLAPGAPPATADDVRPILAQRCALGGCHLHAPGAGGLVLATTSSAWLDAVVAVPAQETSLQLVAPGDPQASWLVHKIDGTFCGMTCTPALGCGGQMPLGSPLADSERTTIIGWIEAGAPRSM